MSLLESLTDEQRAAAASPLAETYVAAGPGAGKSLTLAARVAHLVEQGTDPRDILVLVFTRSAASEIRRRIDEALTFAVAPEVHTFHGLGAKHALLGDRVATEIEADRALRSLYEGGMRRPARGLPGIEELGQAIVEHEATGYVVAENLRKHVSMVLERLEYANLVPTWNLVPLALNRLVDTLERFEHVLIDESQDTSPAELDFARLLLGKAGYLFAVGDERQAIFGFRGARGVSAAPTHRLVRTFRFGAAIAERANEIAGWFNGESILGGDVPDEVVDLKHGSSEEEVAAALREEVEDGLGAEQSVLVLARTNRECAWIAERVRSAVHVRRDPNDPLASERDRFGEVWSRGRAAVSTIHGAKGSEADRVVYLARDRDGNESAEELRVRYVACTRARRRLAVLSAGLSGGAW